MLGSVKWAFEIAGCSSCVCDSDALHKENTSHDGSYYSTALHWLLKE